MKAKINKSDIKIVEDFSVVPLPSIEQERLVKFKALSKSNYYLTPEGALDLINQIENNKK